jgi:glycine cleavage system H lipoate-binding protein
MVPILVLLMVIVFLTFDYFLQRRAALAGAATAGATSSASAAAQVSMPDPADRLLKFPAGVFMAPGHTWLAIETEGSVKLGAGQLPLWLLGGGQIVSMLTPGARVRPGDTVAVLRHGDREVRLRSAIDGTVLTVNDRVRRDPTLLREAPFEETWLYRLSPVNLAQELGLLHLGAAARDWLSGELQRVRDGLAQLTRQPGAAPVLADGGVPQHGLAGQLDAQVWSTLSESLFEDPVRALKR